MPVDDERRENQETQVNGFDWIFEKALPPVSGLAMGYFSLKWAFSFIAQIVPKIERMTKAIEGLRTQLAIVAGQPLEAARDSNEELDQSNPRDPEDS